MFSLPPIPLHRPNHVKNREMNPPAQKQSDNIQETHAKAGDLFRGTLLPPISDTFLSDAMKENESRTLYQKMRNQAREKIADLKSKGEYAEAATLDQWWKQDEKAKEIANWALTGRYSDQRNSSV